MEYAGVCLPGRPPGGVTAGIDWASAGHAVCVVGAAGVVRARFAVKHTAAGLAALVRGLARAGVCEAAIERGDGPLVDALLKAGVTVMVITPRQIRNLRSRYGPAGNKDDRADWLSETRLAGWLDSAGYSGRTSAANLCERLRSAPRGPTGEQGAASAQVTRALAAVLASLNTQIKALEARVAAQLAVHADGHIFTSLPRSGTIRAARLLAEIGDCRAKFPDPRSLICLAAPRRPPASPASTRRSPSAGPSASSCATRSATSPTAPGTTTPGPPGSTTTRSPAAKTTRTRPGSSPAPGSM